LDQGTKISLVRPGPIKYPSSRAIGMALLGARSWPAPTSFFALRELWGPLKNDHDFLKRGQEFAPSALGKANT
jgi:hypothetical protein